MATSALFDTPQSAGVGSPVPDNGTFGDPRVEWIVKQVTRAEPKCNEWKKEYKQNQRFLAGKQLTEEDERALKNEQRPHNAFNSAQKFIRYVSGVQRDSPIQVMFNAISLDNDQVQLFGDMLTKEYDWAMEKSRGVSGRSRSFEDFLVGGMGWTNTYIDRTVDPRGLIGYDRISPLEMIYPENEMINLGQSRQGCTRWRAWERQFEKEEAKALFGNSYAKFLIDQGDNDAVMTLQWPSVDKVPYKIPYIQSYPLDKIGGSQGRKKDQVKIMEFQWWDNEIGYVFADPLDGSEQWMSEREFNIYSSVLRDEFGMEVEDSDRQMGRKWQRAFLLNRRFLLEEPSELAGPRFSFNCMCCHFDEWDKRWYGFFRVLIDPQKYANKFFNQMIEAVAKQAKGGAMFEEGAFTDVAAEEDFINEYAITGSVNRLAEGGLAKVKEKQQPQLPATALALTKFCQDAMENVTGISDAALGLGAATQAGVMLKRRQRAGMVLLSAEFDAEADFRKEEAAIVYDHLHLISDERLIRVSGAPNEPGMVIPLSKAPFSLIYDIELDDVERDPNMRQFLAEWIMGPGGQMLMRAGMFSPDWLNILPFPRSWIMHMKQAMQKKEQEAQKAQAMGLPAPGQRGKTKPLIELQALVKNKDADTMLKQARAQELTAKAGNYAERSKLDTTRLMLDSMGKQQEVKQKQQKHGLDLAQGAMDLFQQATGGGQQTPPDAAFGGGLTNG